MTALVLHLASLSTKIVLLGGMAWTQLYLLRRAPASSRSRLCAMAMAAILLLAAGEMLAPTWMVKTPVFNFTATASAQGASPAAARVSAGWWLAVLWMAGAGFMVARAIVGRAALAMVRRRCTLLQPALSLQETAGIEVRIADVQTPMLVGLLRPTILLPEASRTWTEEQRRMVLIHEFTHFRQGDCWTNLLAQTLRAAFWFHPVVWLLVSRLSREQELTCDEAVVASGHSRNDYASFLLEAVRNLKSREMFACSMAGSGGRSLKLRFANLLDTTPRLAPTRRIAVSLASFALVAMTLTVVRPVWSQSDGKAYKVGDGVTPPKVLSKVEPDYTPEAKDEHVEGPVLLRIIVTAEGTAREITVVKGLHPGLDQKAIEALSKWTFQPGTKDGKAVPVYATVEVNFHLR